MFDELKVYDWQNSFGEIMSSVQQRKKPFLVSNFFTSTDPFFVTAEEFYKTFQELPVECVDFDHQKFLTRIMNGDFRPMSPGITPLKEFVNHARANPTLKSYDNFIPAPFVANVAPKFRLDKVRTYLNPNQSPSYYYRFFCGVKGQETEPHFDWSSNQNFLFQLFGTKVVYLVSPEHFHELPFISNYLRLTTEELIHLSKEKKFPLTKVVLGPGMGLFMPSYYVHSVTYESDSSSLSLRCLPNRNFSRIHRLLPANNRLAALLHYLSDLSTDELKPIQEEIRQLNTYSELLSYYKKILSHHIDEARIPECHPASLRYEEHLYHQQQSFQFQYQLKRTLHAILERGAAEVETE